MTFTCGQRVVCETSDGTYENGVVQGKADIGDGKEIYRVRLDNRTPSPPPQEVVALAAGFGVGTGFDAECFLMSAKYMRALH